MKTGIRTLALALIVISTIPSSSKAGVSSVKPVQFQLKSFVRASIDFMKNSSLDADKILIRLSQERNTTKVCVCEIMQLKSNNDLFENVAVFSEKTNHGDIGADYRKASLVLKKERQHIQQFFFDAVKVTQRFSAATDCVSMYLKLSAEAGQVKMYDILDADIRRAH